MTGYTPLEQDSRQVLHELLERLVIRRLPAPLGPAVVAVGGATFGGSGKTPLAMACAVELVRAGVRTAVVGHAYRAAPRQPRVVAIDDPLEEVGDEALLAARALALEGPGGRVVVAASRVAALEFASRQGDAIVIDGVAQLSPSRADLALLALDAEEPWGRRSFGAHLRAPKQVLLAACDALVPMGEALGDPALGQQEPHAGKPVWPAEVQSRGAWADGGKLLTWEALRALRVGLLTALARPERVVRGLERRGVFPRVIVSARDHGPFRAWARQTVGRARGAVDLWLATPKCALHAATRGMTGAVTSGDLLAVLDHSLRLHPALRVRLRGLSATPAPTSPPHPPKPVASVTSPRLDRRGWH